MELMQYLITLLLLGQSSTNDSHHHSDVPGTGCKRNLAKPLNFYMQYLNRKYQIKGNDVGLSARDTVNPRILLVPKGASSSEPCRQVFLQNTSVEVYPFLTVHGAYAAVYVSSARDILVASLRKIVSFNIDSHKKVLWKDKVSTCQMVVDNEMKFVFLKLCMTGFARVKTDGKEFKQFAASTSIEALATDTYNRIVYVFSSSQIISFTYNGQKLKHSTKEEGFIMPFAQVYAHRKVMYYIDGDKVYEFSLLSNTHKVINVLRSSPESAVFYKHNVYLLHDGDEHYCNIAIMDILNKTTYSVIRVKHSSLFFFTTVLIE